MTMKQLLKMKEDTVAPSVLNDGLDAVMKQRDWLLATLWIYANMINNYEVHVKLDSIGHEHCGVCGGTGRVLDGDLCAFGDEQVRNVKGL